MQNSYPLPEYHQALPSPAPILPQNGPGSLCTLSSSPSVKQHHYWVLFFPPFNPSLHHLPSRRFYFLLTGDPNWTGSSFRLDLFETVDWNSMISLHHVMFLSRWQLESGLVAVNSSDFRTAGRLQRLWRAFSSWIAVKKTTRRKEV